LISPRDGVCYERGRKKCERPERVTGYVPRHSRFADGDVVEPRRNPTNGATCPVRRGKKQLSGTVKSVDIFRV
jgi:hypothetical protein